MGRNYICFPKKVKLFHILNLYLYQTDVRHVYILALHFLTFNILEQYYFLLN
nr:MAG TPA: hypothetical protein [Caudoviricetes sp.]